MVPAFTVDFYKGDTPTLVFDLTDDNGPVSLSDTTVMLYIKDQALKGLINDRNQVAFFFDKDFSAALPVGQHKTWVEFTTQPTKYSFLGYIRVEKAR